MPTEIDSSAWERIGRAVLRSEHDPRNSPGQPQSPGTPITGDAALVRVTSATADDDDFYPGKIVQLTIEDDGTRTYTDFGDCLVIAANEEALTVRRYTARRSTVFDDKIVYVVGEGAGGSSGYTGTKARVTATSCSGGSLSVTSATETYIDGALQ